MPMQEIKSHTRRQRLKSFNYCSTEDPCRETVFNEGVPRTCHAILPLLFIFIFLLLLGFLALVKEKRSYVQISYLCGPETLKIGVTL